MAHEDNNTPITGSRRRPRRQQTQQKRGNESNITPSNNTQRSSDDNNDPAINNNRNNTTQRNMYATSSNNDAANQGRASTLMNTSIHHQPHPYRQQSSSSYHNNYSHQQQQPLPQTPPSPYRNNNVNTHRAGTIGSNFPPPEGVLVPPQQSQHNAAPSWNPTAHPNINERQYYHTIGGGGGGSIRHDHTTTTPASFSMHNSSSTSATHHPSTTSSASAILAAARSVVGQPMMPSSSPFPYYSHQQQHQSQQQYHPLHPTYSSSSTNYSNNPNVKLSLPSQDQFIKNQRRQGAGSILMSGLFHRGGGSSSGATAVVGGAGAGAAAAAALSSSGGSITNRLYNNKHELYPVATAIMSTGGGVPSPFHQPDANSIGQFVGGGQQHQVQLQNEQQQFNIENLTTTMMSTTKKKHSKAQPRPAIHVPPRAFGPVYHPNHNDVLCGRGGRINNHIGNVQFREIIGKRRDEYLDDNTKKLQKAYIAAELVSYIRYSLYPNGRFLKEEKDGTWHEIGDYKAIKKVGQAIREDLGNKDDDSADEENEEQAQATGNDKKVQTSPEKGNTIDVKSNHAPVVQSNDKVCNSTLSEVVEPEKEVTSGKLHGKAETSQASNNVDDKNKVSGTKETDLPNVTSKKESLASEKVPETIPEQILGKPAEGQSKNSKFIIGSARLHENVYKPDTSSSYTMQPSLPVVSTSSCQTKSSSRGGGGGMPSVRAVVSGRGVGFNNRIRINAMATSNSSVNSHQSLSVPTSPASSTSTAPMSNKRHQHHPVTRPKQKGGALQPLAEVPIVLPPSTIETVDRDTVVKRSRAISSAPSSDVSNNNNKNSKKRQENDEIIHTKRNIAFRFPTLNEKGNDDIKRNAILSFPLLNRKSNLSSGTVSGDDCKHSSISAAAKAVIMESDGLDIVSQQQQSHNESLLGKQQQQTMAPRSHASGTRPVSGNTNTATGLASNHPQINQNHSRVDAFFGRAFHPPSSLSSFHIASVDVTDTGSLLSGTSGLSMMSALTDQMSSLSNLSGSEGAANNNTNNYTINSNNVNNGLNNNNIKNNSATVVIENKSNNKGNINKNYINNNNRGISDYSEANNDGGDFLSFSDYSANRNVFTHRNPNSNIQQQRDWTGKMHFLDPHHHGMNHSSSHIPNNGIAPNPVVHAGNDSDEDDFDGMSWTTNHFPESSQQSTHEERPSGEDERDTTSAAFHMFHDPFSRSSHSKSQNLTPQSHYFSSGASITSLAMSVDTHQSYAPSIASVASSMMSDLSVLMTGRDTATTSGDGRRLNNQVNTDEKSQESSVGNNDIATALFMTNQNVADKNTFNRKSAIDDSYGNSHHQSSTRLEL